MLLPDQLLIDDGAGQRTVLDVGGSLTVGRVADLPLGADDEFMHRVLLQFWDRGGAWMVTNRGTTISAKVIQHCQPSMSEMRLSPAASLPLPLGSSVIVCRTATRRYEIQVTVAQTLRIPPHRTPDPRTRATRGSFTPNAEQIELLTALVEPLVLEPGAGDAVIPTVRQLQEKLGWSKKKVNTKIDYLCRVLEDNGYLVLSTGDGLAVSRRIPLARFAIDHYWSLHRRSADRV